MSLLHRVMLLVFLALVPAAAIEVGNELALRDQREAEVHQQALRLSSQLEAEHARLVDGVRQVLVTLARTMAVRSGEPGQCQELLDRLRDDYPTYLSIHVTDGSGRVRCATDIAAVGIGIGDRAHLRAALHKGEFAVGEHIWQRTTGAPALPFALPYQSEDGGIGGAVTALLDLAWLREYLAAKPLPPNASLTVADRNGTVLARVPNLPGVVGMPVPDSYRPLLAAGSAGSVELPGLDGVPRILGYSPVASGVDGMFFAVGIDKAVALAPIKKAMLRELLLIGLVALVTLAAALWGGNRFLRRPVAAVVEATRRWRGGDLSARCRLSDTASEIGVLGQAFDAMAADLEREAAAREEANALAHKMAEVLASTTDGVFEVTRDWRIAFMNDRARILLGGGRDLVGKDLWTAFPEAAGTVFGKQYTRAMEEQEPVEFEGYFPPLQAWYAVRAFPTAGGLAVFFQDITERKRDGEALVAANRHNGELLGLLNSLLEHAPVGFAFFDREHRYIRINDTLAAINGLPADAHIGRKMADVVPANAAALDPVLDQVFATGEPVGNLEIVGETTVAPGVPRQWLTGFYPVMAAGQVVAVGGVVMEITELRGAEAARRQSEERFRAVFEQAAVGIERVALDGRILEVNDKLAAILGCTRDELVGRAYGEVTHPDDLPAEAALVDGLLDGAIPSYAIEKRYRRKDGSSVCVRVTSSLARLTGTEEAYRISMVEDITERTLMEAELRAAKEAAERANLAKTKFLAAASHDLRQPLQSLFFFSAALANHIHDERGRNTLGHVERGLEAMKGLLDSLLDVSRLDAGVVTPEVEDFPVAELIDDLSAAYAPAAAGKGLAWTADRSTAFVRSDRTLLSRMLRNLVENALRYTAEGTVSIGCWTGPRALQIVVRDTGIGIPPDHLERIFDEFHQVGNPERDREQGLGLGLAIVRRLSRLLQHPVEVRSTPGQGSEFVITVPLGVACAPAPRPGLAVDEAKGAGRMAVLIDDDAIVLMGLQAVLKEWGYEVLTANSADQAEQRLEARGRRPDIVIADYRLREDKVGTDAVLRVRSLYDEHIPGVILTGETGTDCLLDAASHGLRVVHKPITPRQLGAALDEHLLAAQ